MTDWDDVAFDARGQLVDVTQRIEPGPPPDFTWTRVELYAMTAPSLFGRLVSLSDDYGVQHNLVVVSDVFTDAAGAWIRVVANDVFMDWGRTPKASRPASPTPARAVPARHVWVMHEKPSGSAESNTNTEG